MAVQIKSAPKTQTQTSPTENVLVSTSWVERHLKDAKVRVVEVDVDTKAYEESHLPGALGWAWNTQLCDPLLRDIIPKDKFGKLLSESGIGNDTIVVLYGKLLFGKDYPSLYLTHSAKRFRSAV